MSANALDSRDVLARLIAIREALEDGDVGMASAVAADFEDELAAELSQSDRRSTCRACRQRFRWPGELAAHHCTASVAA